MKKIYLNSPAKINIGLRIVSRRKDGYHNLESIFQKISFYDKIEVTYPAEKDSVTFYGKYASSINPNENTITRALDQLRKYYEFLPFFSVTVEKNIPHGTGLGGGSSNAAAIISGILSEFNLSPNIDRLKEIALPIGADVLFFLISNTAWVTGIGDEIKPIKLDIDYTVYLFIPAIRLSTKSVYKKFDLALTQNQKNIIFNPLLRQVKTLSDLTDSMYNDLELAAFQLRPELRGLKEKVSQLGFRYVQMTGSGSVIFALDEEGDKKLDLRDFPEVEVIKAEPLR
ncbi:MAG: 4-(cytidine 5'-diphospho)-2-C-methyl-D-erythritol kinase [Calditrichia bacterium]